VNSSWSICACCLGLVSVSSSPILAQVSGGTKVAGVPVDPKALMLQASRSNSLTGPDLKPWHLKATFQLFDDSGNAADTGTYEEFWFGPKKFKRAFTGSAWARTDYGTESGVLRTGVTPEVPSLVVDARHEFVEPLPGQKIIDYESFTLEQIDADGAQLSCLRMTSPTFDPGLTYCFASDQPVLRISEQVRGATQIFHNRILKFQDHFIAGDLKIIRAGKPVLTARVESLDFLNPGDEGEVAPPQDAKPVPKTINISAGEMQGLLSQKAEPIYPPHAEFLGISGTVVLEALISDSGHILQLRVVSGPRELQQAALDAVHTWVYKPYLLNGKPVEVNTTINVIFTLHR
jgi:TonB family protein